MSASMIGSARAPSNIALVKYMGKSDFASNQPQNGSLSLTLDALSSYVEIRQSEDSVHESGVRLEWLEDAPLRKGVKDFYGNELPFHAPSLSSQGLDRALRHLERVGEACQELFLRWGLPLRKRDDSIWEVTSGNTFPMGSGIASSASSFSAMTLAMAQASCASAEAFKDVWEQKLEFKVALAQLSRLGSGSSCRSFLGPWVLWEKSGSIAEIPSPLAPWVDFVLVLNASEKKVSSSEAHRRVMTSPLWDGRVERVAQRLKNLESYLVEGDRVGMARLAWSEMFEMHSLFHTSSDPFTYWEPGTLEAIREIEPWIHSPKPPVMTLDAGANVHLLVPEEEANEWKSRLQSLWKDVPLLIDRQGKGVVLGS